MIVLVILLCNPLCARGEEDESVDYQFRFLLHGQQVVSNGIGVAGWGIVPNTLNTKTPIGVVLGGVVLKQEGRWMEIMAGTFINGRTPDDPLLDIRVSDTSNKIVHFFGEVRYSLKTDTLLISPNIIFPIYTIWDKVVSIGAESDIFITKGKMKYGAGPRFVVPLPIKGWSLAIAYQIGNGQNILRSYLSYTF